MDKSLPVSLPKRAKDSHKGLFGHLWIIGGNDGMAGAPRITAAAALRAGAGRVTLLTRPEYAPFANIVMPELMCLGVNKLSELPAHLAAPTVLAIGPGLGQDEWTTDMMQFALQQTCPLIVDADGLNWLAKHPHKQQHWILTPHVGEAAALLHTDTASIQADRQLAAQALQQQYGGVIVLKGAGTLVAAAAGYTEVFNVGNPGMASPGMGDALTGIIAALVAQHLALKEAAGLGVWIHGTAGDRAAAAGGERGLLASDLLPYIRLLVNA